MNETVRQQLESCRTLPTLPAVATQIVSMGRRENCDMAALADLISQDPVIAARIMSAANSPVFAARGQRITTVRQAVMRMGASSVITLALSFSLVRTGPRNNRALDYGRFWKRALVSGIAARALSEVTAQDPEELFMAGMIQDIGVLALNEAVPDQYRQVLGQSGDDHLRMERIEREVLGTDHREVGAWLAERWGLPEYLIHSVQLSHNPRSEEAKPELEKLVSAVGVSGFVAEIWSGVGKRGDATRQAAECARLWLGMGGESFTRMLAQIAKSFPEVAHLFSIPDDGKMQAVLDEARDSLVTLSLKNAHAAHQAQEVVSVLSREKQAAETKANRDGLTGLYNRRYLDENLEPMFRSAVDLGRSLGVIFVDVDHFKKVNDTHGHPIGDKVLQVVGSVISRCVRQLDIAARYGGEEFVVVLPGTSFDGVRIVAERLRQLIEKADVPVGAGRAIGVTASFGFAVLSEQVRCESSAELLTLADRCLYDAKQNGRNRVVGYVPKS